ncbi:MAG TPA: type III-A CRISPR-associated protein Csm2 [bacterium]|nr:type III-A CRISPR-associated protein Csm2 [bacterium]
MSNIEEAFSKAGFSGHGKKDRGKSFDKGKTWSPEDQYRANIIRHFSENYKQFILTNGGEDYNNYIAKVKGYIQRQKDQITTSQLRNIFSKIKSLASPKDAWRLRPNLAYVAGRSEKAGGTRELVWLLDELINDIKADEKLKLENFKNFFEAIIAYHKYFGGK